ncbi:MAG: hypothetical protein AABZ25_09580 [Nitrospirota bacterium]
MRTIKKEIVQYMTDLAVSDQRLTASFLFPEDFIGFQGHFPGNKILPGVCQIQCVISMLEKWKKKNIVLREIVLAKFFSPISPLEKLTCECRDIKDTEKEFTLKASVSKDGKKISELKLRVCFAGEEIKA